MLQPLSESPMLMRTEFWVSSPFLGALEKCRPWDLAFREASKSDKSMPLKSCWPLAN